MELEPGIGEPPAAETAAPCPGGDVVMVAWGLIVPLDGMAVVATAVWGIEPARLVVDVVVPAASDGGTDPPGLRSEMAPAPPGGVETPEAGMAEVPGLVEPVSEVVAPPVEGTI